MASSEVVKVVLSFIERINARDLDGLCALLTSDHVFTDALGERVEGIEQMRKAWEGYFRLFPDYQITHETLLEDGDTVAVFGAAQATYAPEGKLSRENRWRVPAAWKAVVRDARIAEWRVYTDNQPARRLLGEKVP